VYWDYLAESIDRDSSFLGVLAGPLTNDWMGFPCCIDISFPDAMPSRPYLRPIEVILP
jgi:hypothetical protein